MPAPTEHPFFLEERGADGSVADHVTLDGGEEFLWCGLGEKWQHGC